MPCIAALMLHTANKTLLNQRLQHVSSVLHLCLLHKNASCVLHMRLQLHGATVFIAYYCVV